MQEKLAVYAQGIVLRLGPKEAVMITGPSSSVPTYQVSYDRLIVPANRNLVPSLSQGTAWALSVACFSFHYRFPAFNLFSFCLLRTVSYSFFVVVFPSCFSDGNVPGTVLVGFHKERDIVYDISLVLFPCVLVLRCMHCFHRGAFSPLS